MPWTDYYMGLQLIQVALMFSVNERALFGELFTIRLRCVMIPR
jgi:hypothetical protein